MLEFEIGKYYTSMQNYFVCYGSTDHARRAMLLWNLWKGNTADPSGHVPAGEHLQGVLGLKTYMPCPYGPRYKAGEAISWTIVKRFWDEKLGDDLQIVMPGVPFFVAARSEAFVHIMSQDRMGWIVAEKLRKPLYHFLELKQTNFTSVLAGIQDRLNHRK